MSSSHKALTISERIRLENSSSSSSSSSTARHEAEDTAYGKKDEKAGRVLTLDEQIAALEAGNGSSDSDSDSDSDSESGSDSSDDGGGVRGSRQSRDVQDAEVRLLRTETDGSGRVVKLVSSLAGERITPLSKSHLPSAACGAQSVKPGQKLKDSDEITREKKEKADKKRARIAAEGEKGNDGDKKKKKTETENPVSSHQSGLEATVREMLRNYVPASHEKRPFWCRICRHQAEDQAGMIAHKKSDDHATAAKIEAKMSHCNLCHKQFTSPAQLKEHLNAKAHKERMDKVKRSQAGPAYC